jgi:hypothetical protein
MLNVVLPLLTAVVTDSLPAELTKPYDGQPRCEVSAIGTNFDEVAGLVRKEYRRLGCDDSANAFVFEYERMGNVMKVTYIQKAK